MSPLSALNRTTTSRYWKEALISFSVQRASFLLNFHTSSIMTFFYEFRLWQRLRMAVDNWKGKISTAWVDKLMYRNWLRYNSLTSSRCNRVFSTFPQCNILEILSQNLLCYHRRSFSRISEIMQCGILIKTPYLKLLTTLLYHTLYPIPFPISFDRLITLFECIWFQSYIIESSQTEMLFLTAITVAILLSVGSAEVLSSSAIASAGILGTYKALWVYDNVSWAFSTF